jgi:predicted RNA-binding protein YlqC (UPF0109 family)
MKKTHLSRIFAAKHERKRAIGRPGRRWENIKTNVTDIGPENVDWIHLAKDIVY